MLFMLFLFMALLERPAQEACRGPPFPPKTISPFSPSQMYLVLFDVFLKLNFTVRKAAVV